MAPRARRTKRASVTDIYRGCKASGTCPPDVLNKVENTTLADKILQYGSAGVFFGGL